METLRQTTRHASRDLNPDRRRMSKKTARAWIMNGWRHHPTRAEMKRDRAGAAAVDSTDLQGTIIIAAVRDDCVHDVVQYPAACGQHSPCMRIHVVRRQRFFTYKPSYPATDAAIKLFHSSPNTEHIIVVVSIINMSLCVTFFRSRSQIKLRQLTTWHCSTACSNRSISPVRLAHSSKPAAVLQWRGTDGQTDRRTDARQIHKPWSPYCAGSANKPIKYRKYGRTSKL